MEVPGFHRSILRPALPRKLRKERL
jgi:hypothetical protein